MTDKELHPKDPPDWLKAGMELAIDKQESDWRNLQKRVTEGLLNHIDFEPWHRPGLLCTVGLDVLGRKSEFGILLHRYKSSGDLAVVLEHENSKATKFPTINGANGFELSIDMGSVCRVNLDRFYSVPFGLNAEIIRQLERQTIIEVIDADNFDVPMLECRIAVE